MNDDLTIPGSRCIVGIDYSTTSPCVCLNFKDDYDFHFLTNRKKLEGSFDNDKFIITGTHLPEFANKIERYRFISSWVMDILEKYTVYQIFLEDYAFAATGRVFHIGENTGILKYRLNRCEYQYDVVAPTVIKKFAVGKGNASKTELIDNFNSTHNVKLQDILGTEQDNPISDIVDSYNICRYGQQIVSDIFNCKGAM